MRTHNSTVKGMFYLFFSLVSGKKAGIRRNDHLAVNEMIKKCQSILGSVSAMIFTGTLFLGGSYLFFIQLAEYGW